MELTQARNRADDFIWIGNEAIYVQHRGDAASVKVELPSADPIPYVPRLHGIWDEAVQKSSQQRLTQALGGRLRMQMAHILVAIPDDTTWIELRALQDYFLMSGSGAPDKRLFFYPQSVLLRPAQESFLAITWSCRCLSVCHVHNGSVADRIRLDIARSGADELAGAIGGLCLSGHLPVYHPAIEAAPLPKMPGTGISPAQIQALNR